MKRVLAFAFAVMLLLTACSGESAKNTQPASSAQTQVTTAPTQTQLPTNPALNGTVTVTGEGKVDTELWATATLDDPSLEPQYQWYLDGVALPGADSDKIQVPVNAAGKTLTVGVTAIGYDGEIMSQPVTVLENDGDFRTMAGMYYASKVIGRVFLSESDPTSAHIEWPACGFEFNINATGETLKIHYETNYENTIAVYIDNQEQPRPTLVPLMGGFYCEFPITPGTHIVKILRDGEPQTIQGCALKLKGVEFAGTVLEKPEDKSLYIEIIGDSISSGIGTLGVYQQGVSAKMADHSATHTYGYYVAQDLQADYSIVAKGGIGVIQGAGDPNYNMMDAYEYLWRWGSEEAYSFTRKPDMIILELGANDSPEHDVDAELYKQEIAKFISLLRRVHGADVPILWLGRLQDNYHGDQFEAVQALISELGDPNLYAASFPCGSDGTGGVSGHPSAENHRDFASLVTAYIQENILTEN